MILHLMVKGLLLSLSVQMCLHSSVSFLLLWCLGLGLGLGLYINKHPSLTSVTSPGYTCEEYVGYIHLSGELKLQNNLPKFLR